MKRVFFVIVMCFAASVANAQDTFNPMYDRQVFFDVLNICAIMLVIYLISSFILQLVKQYLDHKLKSRIIEKETAPEVVKQLVIPQKKERGETLIQWFMVLAGIAVGLMIIRATLPFGLHSLAILAACIACGCAGGYYFTRKTASIEKISAT